MHQFCTPTRTSLQSGRYPVHVNTGLGDPCSDNTGVSQNMTGFAEKLAGAGYASRAVQSHPDGGQSNFVWLSARTPHGGASYVR